MNFETYLKEKSTLDARPKIITAFNDALNKTVNKAKTKMNRKLDNRVEQVSVEVGKGRLDLKMKQGDLAFRFGISVNFNGNMMPKRPGAEWQLWTVYIEVSLDAETLEVKNAQTVNYTRAMDSTGSLPSRMWPKVKGNNIEAVMQSALDAMQKDLQDELKKIENGPQERY